MPPRNQQPNRAVQAVANTAQPQVPRTQDDALRDLNRELDQRLEVVRVSAAAGITPQRLKAVMLSTFTRTPGLWDCSPVSIARAVVEAAQLGLEATGTMGGAYLVPFFNRDSGSKEAQLIIGYRGLVTLARRSGEISRVEARVVHENDQFAYEYGLDSYLRHQPASLGRDTDPGRLIAAYAIAFYRDAERQFDVMPYDDIEAIRARSKSKDSGPWVTDYEEMAKKTVLRRLSKLLPLSVDVAAALDEIDPEVDVRTPIPQGQIAARTTQTARDAIQQRLVGAGDQVPEQDPGPVEPPPPTTTAGSPTVTVTSPPVVSPLRTTSGTTAPTQTDDPGPTSPIDQPVPAAPVPADPGASSGPTIPCGAFPTMGDKVLADQSPCQVAQGHPTSVPHESEWGVWPNRG